jgi:hypothetical protein
VTRLDQFKMETRRAFRTLEDRIAKLEATQRRLPIKGKADKVGSVSPEAEKNASAPANSANCRSGNASQLGRVDQQAVMASRNLWSKYEEVAWQIYGEGAQRASKSRFCERHHLSEREFRRCFSFVDQRGLGDGPRAKYDEQMIAMTKTLEETLNESHGTRQKSPLARLKPAV